MFCHCSGNCIFKIACPRMPYGIQICLNSLIPSLFFFMALSSFLMQSGIGDKMFYPLCYPLSKMFRIEKKFVPIFCFSLLGGYPIGPKLIADAISKKEMSPKTGARMLAFCVNCGPAFLISAVSVPIFHNYRIGMIVYLSQILSAFCIGCLLGRKKTESPFSKVLTQNQQYAHLSFSNEFVIAVQTSVKSMALICAFVVAFTGISQVLKDTGMIHAISSLLQYVMTEESANRSSIRVTGSNQRLCPAVRISLYAAFYSIYRIRRNLRSHTNQSDSE